jgi:hypothetical protein
MPWKAIIGFVVAVLLLVVVAAAAYWITALVLH